MPGKSRYNQKTVLITGSIPDLYNCVKLHGMISRNINIAIYGTARNLLSAITGLYRTIRTIRPAVVQSISHKTALYTMVAAWYCGVPVRILTISHLRWKRHGNIISRMLLRLHDITACRFATHINPVGRGVRDGLIRSGITRKPIMIIANGSLYGVDTDRYNRNNAEIREKAMNLRDCSMTTFIYTGALTETKGIKDLCEAFVRVNKNIGNTRLILIKQPVESRNKLSHSTMELINSTPSIQLIENEPDKRAWLAASDVFVNASHHEGFSNDAIEAGAMGLPLIVSDIDGLHEIVETNFNGLKVKPGDVASLQESMTIPANDKDKPGTMSANSARHATGKWPTKKIARAWVDFYERLLSNVSK